MTRAAERREGTWIAIQWPRAYNPDAPSEKDFGKNVLTVDARMAIREYLDGLTASRRWWIAALAALTVVLNFSVGFIVEARATKAATDVIETIKTQLIAAATDETVRLITEVAKLTETARSMEYAPSIVAAGHVGVAYG